MGDFKAFDGGEPFLKPEKPFMVICHIEQPDDNGARVLWFEFEEDARLWIDGAKKDFKDFSLDEFIEIGSCRDVSADIKLICNSCGEEFVTGVKHVACPECGGYNIVEAHDESNAEE